MADENELQTNVLCECRRQPPLIRFTSLSYREFKCQSINTKPRPEAEVREDICLLLKIKRKLFTHIYILAH